VLRALLAGIGQGRGGVDDDDDDSDEEFVPEHGDLEDDDDDEEDEEIPLQALFMSPADQLRRRQGRQRLACKPDQHMLKALEASDFALLTRSRLRSQVPVAACTAAAAAKELKCCSKSIREDSPPPEPLPRPSTFKGTALPGLANVAGGLGRDVVIPAMLANREHGGCSGRGFSRGQQRQVMSSYLPNRGQKVASFCQKVFCGAYSRDGDIFMSACQGNIHKLTEHLYALSAADSC